VGERVVGVAVDADDLAQGAMKLTSSVPSFPAQVTKSLDESTPSKRAASRSDMSCGIFVTGAVIRSAALNRRRDVVGPGIIDLLQGETSRPVVSGRTTVLSLANLVPGNAPRQSHLKTNILEGVRATVATWLPD
jgi:hypothetical protein